MHFMGLAVSVIVAVALHFVVFVQGKGFPAEPEYPSTLTYDCFTE